MPIQRILTHIHNSIDYWIVAFGSILSLLSTPNTIVFLLPLSHSALLLPSLIFLSLISWHFGPVSCHPSVPPAVVTFLCAFDWGTFPSSYLHAPRASTPINPRRENNVLPDDCRPPQGVDWPRCKFLFLFFHRLYDAHPIAFSCAVRNDNPWNTSCNTVMGQSLEKEPFSGSSTQKSNTSSIPISYRNTSESALCWKPGSERAYWSQYG